MNNNLIHNIVRFIVLVLLQVGLFKNMGYYNLGIPFPYILFIFLLPIGIPNLFLYLMAFVTGLTIDAFYDTLGLHAAACVALALFRIFFHRVTLDVEAQDTAGTPSWSNRGFKWFSTYTILGTLVHHFVLFFIEVFSFENFLNTLGSIFLSSLFTILLIFVFSIVIYRRKSRLAN